ncbi:PucR family transcriptional regulator [Clostridium lundense]|uniref:PucR family transcriptional regulator n=1 Tax=Clostridium lundense TaxID=319475 RepID=UPI0004876E87|nr:helix-turn-helix domain-containing protein [Clostridium lundense]
MYNFLNYLQGLNAESKINFKLIWENGECIYNSLSKNEDEENLCFQVELGNKVANMYVPVKYENCTLLLKFFLESKFKELNSVEEEILYSLLDNKEVLEDTIKEKIPFLYNDSNIFLVKVEGNSIEALNIIKELYLNEEALSIIFEDNIVIVGCFDEPIEHAKSIKNSIETDLYCKCIVSVNGKINNTFDLRKCYSEGKEGLFLSEKFSLKRDILYYDKILFEKIVYNIKPQVKNDLMGRFSPKFNNFDGDIINTIEEFVKCDLNISNAAKKLFIHRNTLIYRLDKIYKETGCDIRNFKDASVFIIAFLVWKEINNR